jgi:hypothetical protein
MGDFVGKTLDIEAINKLSDSLLFPHLYKGTPWLTPEEMEKAFAGKKLDFPIKEIIASQDQLSPEQ